MKPMANLKKKPLNRYIGIRRSRKAISIKSMTLQMNDTINHKQV